MTFSPNSDPTKISTPEQQMNENIWAKVDELFTLAAEKGFEQTTWQGHGQNYLHHTVNIGKHGPYSKVEVTKLSFDESQGEEPDYWYTLESPLCVDFLHSVESPDDWVIESRLRLNDNADNPYSDRRGKWISIDGTETYFQDGYEIECISRNPEDPLSVERLREMDELLDKMIQDIGAM